MILVRMKDNHYINNPNTPRGVPRRLPWARPRPAALPAPEPRAGPREIPIISATYIFITKGFGNKARPFYNNGIKQQFLQQ